MGPPGSPRFSKQCSTGFRWCAVVQLVHKRKGTRCLRWAWAKHNWKYLFLRPTILQEIVDRYNAKFRPTETTAAEAGPST